MIVDISSATIFQQDNQVLQNVNIRIDSGEFVYLIGKNGFGKK
jgi:cell division transport system ATP-binding protein